MNFRIFLLTWRSWPPLDIEESSSPGGFHPQDRVVRGGHPPLTPTERSVQISRTTLFRNRFTAQRVIAVPYREAPNLVAAKENEP
jgi:hypothetical protein